MSIQPYRYRYEYNITVAKPRRRRHRQQQTRKEKHSPGTLRAVCIPPHSLAHGPTRTRLSSSANLRPIQDRIPLPNAKKACLGQSPKNREGLNSLGSDQYWATLGCVSSPCLRSLEEGQSSRIAYGDNAPPRSRGGRCFPQLREC